MRCRSGYGQAARQNFPCQSLLPLTAKVRCILAARHVAADSPSSGWVFPSDESESGHINHSTLRKPHGKALRLSTVPEFVLYSLRHSFATRIAPHVDAWTLCKIMGWSSLSVAMRYIHPSEDRVLAAFESHGLTAAPESTTGSNSGSNRIIVGEQPMLELSASTTAAIA